MKLNEPRQIIVIDPSGRLPARKFILRPGRWALALLALVALGMVAGAWLTAPGRDRRAQATIAHLQQESGRLKQALAEAEAELEVSRHERDALKQELRKAQTRIEDLDARVRMFDSILDARKQPGMHILQPRARWRGDGIAVDLILVKGGNYPRMRSGMLRFYTTDPEGREMPLRVDDGSDAGADGLSWLVKNHTFLHARLPWRQSWRPERLAVALLDRHQREIARETITIGGEP